MLPITAIATTTPRIRFVFVVMNPPRCSNTLLTDIPTVRFSGNAGLTTLLPVTVSLALRPDAGRDRRSPWVGAGRTGTTTCCVTLRSVGCHLPVADLPVRPRSTLRRGGPLLGPATMVGCPRTTAPAPPPTSRSRRWSGCSRSPSRRGGSFADLYFEHETTSSLLLEEGIIRTASAGVSCGLGVRVVSGERTGYAYTDDLSWPAMARAAETAAHIAVRRAHAAAAAGLAGAGRPALRRDERRRAPARRADRARRARRPRRARLRPAHREGDREPRRADAPACGSPTRPASWSRTCSRCSRSAST